ncbi:MAG: hypothetical protein SFY81_15365 [Verrucomicrobiota bacterium]|nr:hypothetical protein [Verrucomicrobiota bacterium]
MRQTRNKIGWMGARIMLALTLSAPSLLAGDPVLIEVSNIRGTPTFYNKEGERKRLKEGEILSPGHTIKTGSGDSVDLYLQSVRRQIGLAPNSVLQVEENGFYLKDGQLIGSIRKENLAANFRTDSGYVKVNGGDFLINVPDKSVQVLSGNAEVSNRDSAVPQIVKAGESQSFAGSSAQLSEPQKDKLLNRIDFLVSTHSSVTETFQAASTFEYCPPCPPQVSPECDPNKPNKPKGNNGVGNGYDPQPPGNPPINDGPGTGPGNPGNRGGSFHGGKSGGGSGSHHGSNKHCGHSGCGTSCRQQKGNNGVGNGYDPQPPGNPPINDGHGTSPGNPGNRRGTRK